MADPVIASIPVAFTAVQTGAAIATWWQGRQDAQEPYSTDSPGTRPYHQQPKDLLYVLATMGRWLFSLDVIDFAVLPAAREACRSAFVTADPEDDELGKELAQMSEIVQYAVTAGMVFCAEWLPVHMWQGFGCGVFSSLRWAGRDSYNLCCMELDDAVVLLKSQPRLWRLLKKSPAAIGKTEPQSHAFEKSAGKKRFVLAKNVLQQFDKDGFPQPKAPYNHIRIDHWWIPCATWNGSSLYCENEYDNADTLSTYQCDPGRFLWAWTAGKRASINEGEAVLPLDEHIASLAKWLEGLQGITFRVLLNTDMDFSRIKFDRAVRKLNQKLTGNEYGLDGSPFVLVYDPRLDASQTSPQLVRTFSNLRVSGDSGVGQSLPGDSPASSLVTANTYVSKTTQPPMVHLRQQGSISSSNVQDSGNLGSLSSTAQYLPGGGSMTPSIYSLASGGMSTPTVQSPRRRPLPIPPSVVLRTVSAMHNFIAESPEELTFAKGDVMEVLDDKSDDGWWKARLGQQTGLIPSTFVEDVAGSSVASPSSIAAPLSAAPSTTSVNQNIDYSNVPQRSQQPPGLVDDDRTARSLKKVYSAGHRQPAGVHSHPSFPSAGGQRDPLVSTTGTSGVDNNHIQQGSQQQCFAQGDGNSYNNKSSAIDQGRVRSSTAETDQQIRHNKAVPVPKAALHSLNQTFRQPTLQFTFQQSKAVECVEFSPQQGTLASGSREKTIALWDISTGASSGKFGQYGTAVRDIAFSPDGTALAAAANSEHVILWDVRTQAIFQAFEHGSSAQSVAISSDGRVLAVALSNNRLDLWDLRSSAILHKLRGHKSIVNCVAFSPDSTLLASGSNDKMVKTWNSLSGQLAHSINAHPGMMNYVRTVEFSPDGKILASGSYDGTIKLWAADSGKLLHTLRCSSVVSNLAFSPDGVIIAAATMSKKCDLWNVKDGAKLCSLEVHSGEVTSVAFSRYEGLLATASEDKTVKLWKYM